MYFDILNHLGVDHECDWRTDRQNAKQILSSYCLFVYVSVCLPACLSAKNNNGKLQIGNWCNLVTYWTIQVVRFGDIWPRFLTLRGWELFAYFGKKLPITWKLLARCYTMMCLKLLVGWNESRHKLILPRPSTMRVKTDCSTRLLII